MQNGQELFTQDEFKDLFSNWQEISLDFQYENHPDQVTLDRYVHGSLLMSNHPELSSAQDVSAWLDGRHGWSSSAISLHIVSCSECRSEISQLRDVYERENVHKQLSWWKQIQENPVKLWSLSTLRRSAIAVAAAMVLFGGGIFITETIQNANGNDPGVEAIQQTAGGASIPDEDSAEQISRLF